MKEIMTNNRQLDTARMTRVRSSRWLEFLSTCLSLILVIGISYDCESYGSESIKLQTPTKKQCDSAALGFLYS